MRTQNSTTDFLIDDNPVTSLYSLSLCMYFDTIQHFMITHKIYVIFETKLGVVPFM